MSQRWRSKILKWGALAGLVLWAAACADERPPRSFVQPNALRKADLEGTYHYVQTVTDAPPTNGAMFVGQSSNLLKIRFDVQEGFLYARRAFEHIQGSEDAKVKDPADYMGAPLAAWRITSHFDVIRDFNSSTGEQTNRIIESQERPWHEREFLRVDWSQNLVVDYVGLGIDLFFGNGQPQVQPVSYWESDPSKPDALHLEHLDADQGGLKKGQLAYLDVTHQLIVTPEMLTLSFNEGGQNYSFTYPRCFFGYETSDCASQKVKVRHAFARIDPVHDYEPRDWDGKQMNMFGVWDVGLRRVTYNRDYGLTNSGAIRHAARFNVWEKSCRTGVSCEASAAENGKVQFIVDGVVTAVWDPAVDRTKPWVPGDDARDPRLPYAQRTLRQIPYYAEGTLPVTYDGSDPQMPAGLSESIYPPSLWPQFADIVHQWDDALRDAVKSMTGTRPELPIFVACHNPVRRVIAGVQEGDPDVCARGLAPVVDSQGSALKDRQGRPIVRARQGDPRRSIIFWVNQQQNAGPLGYGPPLFDEETGETVSGQAYIYGAAIDSYVARARDLLLLQNGELDTAAFVEGRNVAAAVDANRPGSPSARVLSDTDVARMSGAMDFDWARAFTPANGYPSLDASSAEALRTSLSVREKSIHKGYFEHRVDTRQSRLERLAGTPLEKMLATTEQTAIAGVSPLRDFDRLSPSEKALVSPIRRRVVTEEMAKFRLAAEKRGVDFAEFDDASIGSHLSKYLKKYGPQLASHADDLRVDLRGDIFLAVALHEMGHNVGCRHNFRGSWDSMNYFPDYWKLRTDAVNHPDPGMEPADGRLHPRYVNKPGGKETAYELEGGIRDAQYSSIMDYGNEFNSDLLGLGLYDKAFMKFSYARAVEVFTGNKRDATTRGRLASLQQFQDALGFPSALDLTTDNGDGFGAISYQSYPQLFQEGVDGMYKRKDVAYADILSRSYPGTGSALLVDREGNPMVPYYFCSDEYAGNLTCQRFDAGADAWEQATDVISRYRNYYLLNNFKRDRLTFHSSLGYLDRIAGRYFEPLRIQMTWYVLLRSDFEGYFSTKERANAFFTGEDGWGNFTAGVTAGFDELGRIITTPNPGTFGQAIDASGEPLWTQLSDDLTTDYGPDYRKVGLLDGKYIDTAWNYECGYYWSDECQSRIGYFVDKTLALDVLSQSQAYFTGRDTSVDVRRYAIGYVLPFKAQLEEKIGAMLSDDLQSTAPYYVRQGANWTVANDPWSLADPSAPKADRIDPAMGFTLGLYAGAYALASFPTTFDHEFLDNTKVFVLGNGEAFASDAEVASRGTYDPAELVSHGGTKEWLLYRDEASGKVYAGHAVAPRTTMVPDVNSASGATRTAELRPDIGVRMLEHLKVLGDRRTDALALPDVDTAKESKIAATDNEFQKFRQNVEVVRSLHNAFGYGPFMTDAPFYY